MAGIIKKIEQVLARNDGNPATGTTGYDNTTGHHATGRQTVGTTGVGGIDGPHSSATANKLDPRVDSDRDGSTTVGGYGTGTTAGYNTTGTGVTGSTNAGPHNSNLLNKLDPRVDSDLDGSTRVGTTGTSYGNQNSTSGYNTTGYNTAGTGVTGSTNAGPHNSNLANKLDPRVDSDLDGSTRVGTTGTSYGNQRSTGPTTGYNTTGYNTAGTGVTGSTNSGPHQSNLANKIDPRVDSDLDGSTRVGAAGTSYGNQNSTGGYNTTGYNTAGNGVTGSTNAGPHNSNLANKLDPRVDSDRDGSTTVGNTTGAYGTQRSTGQATGYGTSGSTLAEGSTNAGPHNSNAANTLDPRVDSNRDGSSGTNTFGSTKRTAGPHKSDLLNKLDPRVDSDLDGSRTIGG